jgi:hypothetical protein
MPKRGDAELRGKAYARAAGAASMPGFIDIA